MPLNLILFLGSKNYKNIEPCETSNVKRRSRAALKNKKNEHEKSINYLRIIIQCSNFR
jgi:hypothetical protein